MNRKRIEFFIIILQLADILVHLLTNQFELTRVISNGLVIAWVLFIQLKIHKIFFNLVTSITLSIYIIFNGLLVLEYGIINPNNLSIRLPLILFVLLTIILVIILIIKETHERKRM